MHFGFSGFWLSKRVNAIMCVYVVHANKLTFNPESNTSLSKYLRTYVSMQIYLWRHIPKSVET